MDPLAVGFGAVGLMVVLVLCGVRIAYAMSLCSLLGMFLMSGNINTAIGLVGNTFFTGVKELNYAVLPLFIMVGVILSVSDLGADIYVAAEVALKKVRGGLAMATVIANAIFAAMVGASIASAAAFSKISYGPMTKAGYDKKLAVGSIAGSSVLGMLIPPSLLFILFGTLTGASVGKMFMAGIIPGIILALFFCVQIFFQVHRNKALAPKNEEFEKLSRKESLKRLLKPWGCILLIVVVLGGIYAGMFTPTEAGAVGVFGSLLIAGFSKRLSWKKVKTILLETGETVGSILMLLVAAKMFQKLVSITGIINFINGSIITAGLPIIVVIILVLVLCLVLGCILDSASIFLLILPMMTPILTTFNVDLIWFGVIFTIVVEMGLITPPFGICVFTVKSALGGKVKVEEIFRGAMPYLISMVLIIVLLFIFPQLVTWLPGSM